MATAQQSKSAAVRARLNHPVIDSDGHTVEFEPAVMEYLHKVGGPGIVERYKAQGATSMAGGLGSLFTGIACRPKSGATNAPRVLPGGGCPRRTP